MAASTRTARIVAAILIVSTPISGIITFAVAAILFGEERLEDSGGLTPTGLVVIAIPAIVGLAVLLWSVSTAPFPSRKVIAGALGVAAAILVGIGLASIRTSAEASDVSVGGALLVLFAVPIFAAALVLWIRTRERTTHG